MICSVMMNFQDERNKVERVQAGPCRDGNERKQGPWAVGPPMSEVRKIKNTLGEVDLGNKFHEVLSTPIKENLMSFIFNCKTKKSILS